MTAVPEQTVITHGMAADRDATPIAIYGDWIATVPRTWSAKARQNSLNAFLDVIAVMVPGARDEATSRVFQAVRDWGTGAATIVGHAQRMAAPWAAMVNGVAAHALDFDDNFDPAKAHATAVLAPALFAAGEAEDATGADLVDAYIVGLEIMCRVGQALNPYHRARGWHATSTIGAVGAAAAVARLLRLESAAARHALSLSTSMSGGFMSQFGTMAKPLHAGLAAKAGVMAGYLARSGVTAGENTLDGRTGMATLMVGPDRETLRASLAGKAEHGQTMTFKAPGDEGLAIETHGLKVKRFPNCGSVHRALDGLLELREAHGLEPGLVDEILIRAPAAHLANLMYHDPGTPMEARFSMEYGVAVGLVNGAVTLADFLPDALHRKAVRSAMEKVRLEPVDRLESEFPTEVIVTLRDGNTVIARVAMPVGSKVRPLTRAQLLQKLRECSAGYLPGDRLASLEVALAGLDGPLAIRQLMRLLVF